MRIIIGVEEIRAHPLLVELNWYALVGAREKLGERILGSSELVEQHIKETN